MPTHTQLQTQLHDKIAQFIQEIDTLIRAAALEAVHEALGGPAGAAKPRTAAPRRARATRKAKTSGRKPAARSGKRVRRSADEVESLGKRVLAHVRANPGQRLGEIAKALALATKDARRPAFLLVESKQLRTEGNRGGTRYFPGSARAGGAAPARKRGKKAGAKKAKKAARKTGRKKKTTKRGG